MKKLLLSIAVMAFLGTGCSTNANKEEPHEHGAGTHQHADETIQNESNTVNPSVAEQEEFTVAGDSAQVKENPNEHSHDGQEAHEHE